MADPRPSPPESRAQDRDFVRQCGFVGLRPQLPLRWPTPPEIPASPKKQYRSYYVYLGCTDLDDLDAWQHLSSFDLVLRLVDFGGLRPVLAWLLGWTSSRGQVPFDPVSMFLFISWRIVNGWTRAQALRNLQKPRYADYARCFGFLNGDFPTEGGVRYFLTTLGNHVNTHQDTVAVQVDDTHTVDIAIQYLNYLLAGAVALLRDAYLITEQTWQRALLCPDGMIHDAASRMRCAFVQDACYRATSSDTPRPCPAQEKGKRGCTCDTLSCVQACRYAPVRDAEARSIYYAGTNQPARSNPNAAVDPATKGRGKLRYGYRSLTLQFADFVRRFSVVLLDDFRPANEREENRATALLLLLAHFYPDLVVNTTAGDAGLGFFAFLHAAYCLGIRRAVDLRADPGDTDKQQWPLRGYNDKGRPICPYGYAFTANGFDTDRRRHKWLCGQACLKGTDPVVQLDAVSYPPDACPYQDQDHPHGKVLNVAETFDDGSIRLARDIPVGTPTWDRLYYQARNASEDRNADLEAWHLKRLPVYGQPRGSALIALADTWINLTALARLVKEATFAPRTHLD
ncbi:MAG: hypothetical protein PVH17_13395 [Anaerolineae bacterium]